MLGREIVCDPSLSIHETKRQRRLITKIDTVKNVLEITLAKRDEPRPAFFGVPWSLQHESGVGGAGADLALNFLPVAFPAFDGQYPGRAIRIADGPRALIKRHILREIAVEYRQRAVVSRTISRVYGSVEQNTVEKQTDPVECSPANREFR